MALLARRAIGRVEQLTQAPKGEQPGFDVATVILNADAAKVYATAIRLLHKNQTVHVDAEDATLRTVQSRLSQILVASVTKPGQTSDDARRRRHRAGLSGDEGLVQRAIARCVSSAAGR